jgi:hypothetical protein
MAALVETVSAGLDAAAETASYSIAGTYGSGEGLGIASQVQERTARAAEETARNTRSLADKAVAGGLTFG